MKEVKNKLISIRVTEGEYQHLLGLSEQSNITISEYSRLCLLEVPIQTSTHSSQEHKELMKLCVRTFCLIKEMAKDNLTPDQYQECIKLAEEVLREWNYE